MKTLITSLLTMVFVLAIGPNNTITGQKPAIDQNKYKVVVNHEEQYSILLSDQSIPNGWKDTRKAGTRKQCQQYIEEVWTDMRPLSIQKLGLSEKRGYMVVINHEEQYSIWPEYKEIPLGWKAVGKSGPKAECLEYIKEVWTDMRPLSLRKQMEAAAKKESEN